MKISIIIPVHNAEKTIENSVSRIIDQDEKGQTEIVLIENGSEDKSLQICKNLSEKFENVKTLHSDVTGPSSARNMGLDNCTGDVIGFCDADDTYEPGTIKCVSKIFEADAQIEIVIGSMKLIRNDGLDWIRSKKLKNELVNDSCLFFERLLCDAKVMGSVCNKFYRRDVIGSIRFRMDLDFCEDTFFNINVIKNNESFKIKLIKKITYRYVKTGNNSTENIDRLFDGDVLKYIIAMNEIEKEFVLNKAENRAIKNAKYVLAVDNYDRPRMTEKQKANLMVYIKKGIRGFKKTLFKYTFVRNLKFILKGYKILLFH